MSPTAVPTRITIDFHDALLPSRSWILGIGEPDAPERVELLAFEPSPRTAAPAPTPALSLVARRPAIAATVLDADCTCPEYCERDHANE